MAIWVNEMQPWKDRGTNAVEIETITKHQLPGAQRLDFEGLDRAKERETELIMTGERRGHHRQGKQEKERAYGNGVE